MPRKKIDAPSYRYQGSGKAVVSFDGRNYYLGPHDSPESKPRYYALLNQYHRAVKKVRHAKSRKFRSQLACLQNTDRHSAADADSSLSSVFSLSAQQRTHTFVIVQICQRR